MGENISDYSRRKFIASSLGCLASAGLATVSPGLVRAQDSVKAASASGTDIIYRTLGRTGLKLPIVSMGAGACNDPALVQASYEIGMRHFDTAANYAYGRNEQMVGNVIAKMNVRDKAIIGTKIHTPGQRQDLTPEQSKKKLIETVEGCLRRLRTDYVDILYVHSVSDPESVKDPAIIETLAQFKEEGKTRFVGISTHANMASVINETVQGGFYDVVLTSINFTMADDTDLLAAIANAASKGVGVIAMKTQAGGARFPNPDTLREYSGSTINSAALKWVLRNENIATSIPGIGNYDHMREDFAVAGNLDYTEEEEKFLSDNRVTLGMGFCRQCSSCLASCPGGADIPNLMRTHMYAAQYGDFHLARTTLDEIPKQNGIRPCLSCSDCTAQCVNSVDIPHRIAELKLMYA